MSNPIDFTRLARAYQATVDPAHLERFAASLGITAESLTALGIGRDRSSRAWTFPERDGWGQVIGVQRRFDTGKKFMVKGSARGITLRWPLDSYAGSSPFDPILIVEGATDAAAGMTIGVDVVGRPSATGGAEHLRVLLAHRHCAIIGENDDAGRRGAESIGRTLSGVALSVRTIYPPALHKDLRSWVLARSEAA